MNPLNTIDKSRDIVERNERGREMADLSDFDMTRVGSERYVPQLNAKKQSPDYSINYRAIVEDISKMMGVIKIKSEISLLPL